MSASTPFRKQQQGFSTHNHTFKAAAQHNGAPARNLAVPRPRSMHTAKQYVTPYSSAKTVKTDKPSTPEVKTHNPYGPVTSPSLRSVLPPVFYRQLAPLSGHGHGHFSSHNPHYYERMAMDRLLHGGAFVTFHAWESIRHNLEYEEEVLGVPSPLQPMHVLVDLVAHGEAAATTATKYGCHMGQFLTQAEFHAENFLTLRILADVSGVTLYKCDFDAKNCCRVFLDGPESYERLVAWNKRLRVTPYGVLIAQDQRAADDLELVHLGNKTEKMPYHTIPIEAMRTSHETNGPAYQRSNQARSGFQYQQPSLPRSAQCTPPPAVLTSAELRQVADDHQNEVKLTPDHMSACRDGMTPSPVPSSAYASDCEATPIKSSDSTMSRVETNRSDE